MKTVPRWILAAVGISLFVSLAGCGATSSETAARALDPAGTQFLLTQEPVDAVSIATIVENQEASESASPVTHTVIGRIHAGEYDPFSEGVASFLVSELPDPNHGDGSAEHADNCPFCKREADQLIKAIVEFQSPEGSVMPIDARQLLGVSAGDIVVIEGECFYDEALDMVKVAATGIYRRP